MKTCKMRKLLTIILLVCAVFATSGCSSVMNKLPPLPTPKHEEPTPEVDIYAQQTPSPEEQAVQTMPVYTPEPTPVPTPVPTPEPTPEDPNVPHLYIENATYPENMAPYTAVQLYGEIYTDKGVIAMVWGRLVDENGVVVQNCKYYPYTDSFSLAGTINAELRFGLLEPGHYTYIVSAIAENKSFTNGEEVLINHPFEVFYP